MAGRAMKSARQIYPACLALILHCAALQGAASAQTQIAALDGARPPGLGEIEQFPILPREAAPAQPSATRPAPSQPQAGNPLWAIPLRTLSATRERPIFSPSRRPATPPSVAAPAPAPQNAVAAPPPPERPSLVLIGTIIGEGESIGIFYNPTTRASVRLRVGESDEAGWKLTELGPRNASLQKAQQSIYLALPAPGEAASTAASPGPRLPEPDL
jgi:general secretion pathway protein N